MHLLVTGGAGYLGSAAAQALLAAGHTVTVFDNLSHGHRAAVPAGARFVHGDLAHRTALDDLLASQPYEAALRYFNAAGALPGRGEAHQPESHLIPRVLAVAQGRAESLTLYGTDYPTPDGTPIRDYIHIADLVSAHLLVLDALAPQTGHAALAYHLGHCAGHSVRQVVE